MGSWIFLEVSSDYPKRFNAGNTKMEFMAMGLQKTGCQVLTINNRQSITEGTLYEQGVSSSGIVYVTFSFKKFGVFRNYKKTRKLLREFKQDGDNFVVISAAKSHYTLLDLLAAKQEGYKTLFLLHEWRTALRLPSFAHKVDAYIKDYLLIKLFDAYLPISHFLLEKCPKKKKKYIVPVLAEYYENHENHENSKVKPIFSYCCDVFYILRHSMILDAFDSLVKSHPESQLLLVLSGNDNEIERFKSSILSRNATSNIIVKTKLPYDELMMLYKQSAGLIIPLNPESTGDIARFSQKIAEYVSTRRPIITNNVGEIPYYFNTRESAYIVDYSAEGLCAAMGQILDNPSEADKIGNAGYEVGLRRFDYNKVMQQVVEWSKQI